MILSLNEVETLARKAACGAGVAVGVAEDFGSAVRVLSASRLDGPALAARALAALGDGRSAPPSAERKSTAWRMVPADPEAGLSACLAGPATADLALAFSEDIVLFALDVPEIVAGYLAAAGDGRCRALASEDGPAVVAVDGAVFLVAGEGPLAAGTFTCRPFTGALPGRLAVPTDGVPVEAKVHAALDGLAARLLVPATDLSRERGAGAGLIDGD